MNQIESWVDDKDWEDDRYQWTCDFPGECLMPGDHMRAECHTQEMVEEWARDFRRSLHRYRRRVREREQA